MLFSPNIIYPPFTGLKHLLSASPSGAAAADFTTKINASFNNYLFLLNLTVATDGTFLQLRISDDGGISFEADAGDYEYGYTQLDTVPASTPGGSASATFLRMTNGIGNASTEGANGFILMSKPADTALYTPFVFLISATHNNNDTRTYVGGGSSRAAAAVNGVRFMANSGNITGRVDMYGLSL